MSRVYVQADWNDVPHLSEQEKAELLESIPLYQRDARTKGIPQLGSGAIYPVPESDIRIPDFKIPDHWPRAYGLDVGWRWTSAVWGAHDRDSQMVYFYSVHHMSQAEPAVHAAGIRARGEWIPGRIDASARGRSVVDGRQLLQMYKDLGLRIEPCPRKSVETGIYKLWTLLSSGRLKVFESLHPWFEEFRLYRRDQQGKIVKERDHCMDASRYLTLEPFDWWQTAPVAPKPKVVGRGPGEVGLGWMG